MGGHPWLFRPASLESPFAAAGFVARARDAPDIQERLQGLARAALQGVPLAPTLWIDAQVSVKDLLGDTFRFIRSLAPFGQGNPAPVFMTRGVQAVGARRMGDQGQHLRLTVRDGGAMWDAVAFDRTWPASLPFPERGSGGTPPVSLDLAYTMEVNTYQGRESVHLRLLGLRPARA